MTTNPFDIDNLTTQTVEVSLAIGTTAATYSVSKTLRKEYDECIGMAIAAKTSGDLPYYSVALVDKVTGINITDMAHKDLFLINANTPANERFTKIYFKSNSRELQVDIKIPATVATTALAFDVILLTRKTQA